jgi:hypothetical protein
MEMPHPRFRLNAPGDFYVEDGMCLACTAPEHEAPDLMANYQGKDVCYHCYFRQQPRSAEELEQPIRAVHVACCGAVKYAGSDQIVLQRLMQLRMKGSCDVLD